VLASLYTFIVYCASAITVPSYPYVAPRHGLSETPVSLILALYVLGYALGPLIAAPMSEIPWIGRNLPYWVSFIPFLIISIVLTQIQDLNFATICVLRFLQGYFGSPILATGAASYDDIFDEFSSPYGYMLWLGAMYAGPAVGPLLSGYAVVKEFRWPYWEVAIMAAALVPLILLLPETSSDYILLQRAKRLRKLTGDLKYRARSEIKEVPVTKIFVDALMKPTEIAVKDPAIGFVTIYGGIVYATYYSFFEVSFLPSIFHGGTSAYEDSLTGVSTRLLREIPLLSRCHWVDLPHRHSGIPELCDHLRHLSPIPLHTLRSGRSG
jgi:DHA1 family multidrug resistance protein-like MFS transporter